MRDVIVVGYGYTTGTRGPAMAAAIDYYRGLMVDGCRDDGAAPRCHFVDPVEVLKGKIGTDGVHPTAAGHDALAKMVWERMQAEGVRR